MRGVSGNNLVKVFVTASLLCWAHDEALVDSSCNILKEIVLKIRCERSVLYAYSKIPWVHQQRLLHVLANSHKLTEDARALVGAVLGNNELHARGVHSVSQGCDDSQISHTQ